MLTPNSANFHTSSSSASSPSSISYSIVSTLSNMSTATKISSSSFSMSQADKVSRVETQPGAVAVSLPYNSIRIMTSQPPSSGSGSGTLITGQRKVRIDTGPTTIIGELPCTTIASYQPSYYVNGYLSFPRNMQQLQQPRLQHHSDPYDQNSSSSNSSASYPLVHQQHPQQQQRHHQSAPSNKSSKLKSCNNVPVQSSSSSSSNRHLKPPPSSEAESTKTTSSPVANTKNSKPKSSPKHLLYEVLLSPIKRKVTRPLLEPRH